jgi:hypothetical protein
MNPKFVRVATHIVIVLLSIIGGILAIADKVSALPFIPPDWTNKWGLFVAAAISIKPILLIIGDWLDDGIINQSFKSALPLLLVGLLLTGCATDTGDPAKDRRGRITNAVATEAATVAWDFILISGENFLKGKGGPDAASAAFAAAKDTVVMYDAGAGIRRIREAAGPKVATAAAAALKTANPQNPAQVQAAFNSVGAAFQASANARMDDGQP